MSVYPPTIAHESYTQELSKSLAIHRLTTPLIMDHLLIAHNASDSLVVVIKFGVWTTKHPIFTRSGCTVPAICFIVAPDLTPPCSLGMDVPISKAHLVNS